MHAGVRLYFVFPQILLGFTGVFLDLLVRAGSGLRKAGDGGRKEQSEERNGAFYFPHIASIRRVNGHSCSGPREKKEDGEVPPSSPRRGVES